MKLPKQVYIPYVGAVYELVNRVFFFVSAMNFLLMTRVYYYNTGDAALRDFCGSYWIFMAGCAVLCAIVAIFSWAVIIPSQTKFQQDQVAVEGRSLMYEKICEIEKQLQEIKNGKRAEDSK